MASATNAKTPLLTAEKYKSRLRYLDEVSARAKPAIIKCLGCNKDFKSPDRVRIRICSPCKRGSAWREGVASKGELYAGNRTHLRKGPSPKSTDEGATHRPGLSRNALNTPGARAARKKFEERN